MKKPHEVIGFHPDGVTLFPSMNAAAKHIGCSLTAIVNSIRTGSVIKGWSFNIVVK